MRVFSAAVFLFLISLLSITALAQTPTPTPTSAVSPTTSATNAQATLSPSPSPPAEGRSDRPNLPYLVEGLACAVMVGSVLAVYLLVRQQLRSGQGSIGPRHIQFVSVCLIVPTILILGLEQWLSRETTATLIGGLAGYLLSGLGKSEPPGNGGNGTTKTPEPSPGATKPNTETQGTQTQGTPPLTTMQPSARPGRSGGSALNGSGPDAYDTTETTTSYGETSYGERGSGETTAGA